MKTDKTLIVILSDYPYNNGEPFFENEINFLSKAFKEIIVFSVMGKYYKKQTRNYPGNVSCVPLGCNHNRLKYILRGLFSTHHGFHIFNKNIFKFLMNLYIYGRNNEIFYKIKKHLLKHDRDLSNCVIYSYWLTLGISAINIKKYVQKKYEYEPFTISRCHRYDLYNGTNKYNFQPMQEETVKFLNYVCSCSDSGKRYLRRAYPRFEDKFVTSKLGTRFHEIRNKKNATNQKTVVTCSGLRPVKRLDLFAEGFALASRKNDDLHWICIGEGEEKNKIADIVKQNNISGKVTFMGDLSNEDVYKYYENNQIFCFANTSSSEGIPVSIMEAISYGIPVIATDVGGTNEIVDSSNGILLNKDCSKQEICSAILKLCSLDSDNYSKMKINSRRKWEQEYNADENYKKWINFLLNNKF